MGISVIYWYPIETNNVGSLFTPDLTATSWLLTTQNVNNESLILCIEQFYIFLDFC